MFPSVSDSSRVLDVFFGRIYDLECKPSNYLDAWYSYLSLKEKALLWDQVVDKVRKSEE